MRYALKKDLIIPAGTVFDTAASKTERYTDHIEYDLALGNDNTISIVVPVEDDGAFNSTFLKLEQ